MPSKVSKVLATDRKTEPNSLQPLCKTIEKVFAAKKKKNQKMLFLVTFSNLGTHSSGQSTLVFVFLILFYLVFP